MRSRCRPPEGGFEDRPPEPLGNSDPSPETRSRRGAIKRFLLAPATGVAAPGLVGLVAILVAVDLGLGAALADLACFIADKFRPPSSNLGGPAPPLPSLLPPIILLLGVAGVVRTIIVGAARIKHPRRPPRPPSLSLGQPDAPAFQAGLLGGTPRRLSQEDVESIVELLAYVPTDPDEDALDIPASIERTVRAGGLVQLEHPLRGRIPAVVVVEDDWSAGRYWNPIAGDLAEGLETRGVAAEHVLFFGTFADLRAPGAAGREGAGTVLAGLLERLQALSPAVVFIVTDGAHLRSRFQQVRFGSVDLAG